MCRTWRAMREPALGLRVWSLRLTKLAGYDSRDAFALDERRLLTSVVRRWIFEAGQHQLIHEDFATFCEAMA